MNKIGSLNGNTKIAIDVTLILAGGLAAGLAGRVFAKTCAVLKNYWNSYLSNTTQCRITTFSVVAALVGSSVAFVCLEKPAEKQVMNAIENLDVLAENANRFAQSLIGGGKDVMRGCGECIAVSGEAIVDLSDSLVSIVTR